MKLLLITLSLFIAGTSYGANLKKVNSYAKDGAFVAELSFDEAVSADQVSLDYINETVQVNLSQTSLDKSISTKVTDDKVRTIYTYKLDDGSSRARIIYKDGIQTADFQSSTTVEANGKKILVRISDRAAALPAKTADATTEKAAVSDEDLTQAAQWLENADKNEKTAVALKEAEAKALENKKESEIPILATKKAEVVKEKSSSTARIILSVGLVFGLLFGFSFFLKKYVKKSPHKKNSQIKVLTQHYLGPKKSLAIIRVAGESMLIGVTDNNINLIKTLALLDEEIPQDTPKNFSQSLDKSMNDLSGQDDEAEEFSISKIKDFVSGRLKNMKEI